MIENINFQNFQKYGIILNQPYNPQSLFEASSSESVTKVDNKGITQLVSCKGPVLLDNLDGLALLCVSLDASPQEYEVFLLDKPVCLHRGVWHNVLALMGSATIRTYSETAAQVREMDLAYEYAPVGAQSRVEIDQVHTLFYEEKERGFIFRGESHDFWEMMYVDAGSVNVLVDGKGFKVDQGEALFFGGNQFHVQWADPDVAACFVTISFHLRFEDSRLLLERKFILDQELKNIVKRMLYEKDQKLYDMENMIICCLKELIIKLVRMERMENILSGQSAGIKLKMENYVVQKAVEYIGQNISEKLSLSEIAQRIPVCQSYLSTIFKKVTGKTMIQYINDCKLEKSKELIRNTNMNFTQVSMLLGYSSVHYFSSQFKTRYGISPKEFSRSIRG